MVVFVHAIPELGSVRNTNAATSNESPPRGSQFAQAPASAAESMLVLNDPLAIISLIVFFSYDTVAVVCVGQSIGATCTTQYAETKQKRSMEQRLMNLPQSASQDQINNYEGTGSALGWVV